MPSATSRPHPGLARDRHAASRSVTCPRVADLPRHLDVVADDRRAREAGKRGDGAMLADSAVVPDLHEVVDLRAGADPRAAGLRAVDARVRADLHVVVEHHVADLRNSLERPSTKRPAEAVAADHAARVQHDAVADARSRSMTIACGWSHADSPTITLVADVRARAHHAPAPDRRSIARRTPARRRRRRRPARRRARRSPWDGETARAGRPGFIAASSCAKAWRAFSTTSSGLPAASGASGASTSTAPAPLASAAAR